MLDTTLSHEWENLIKQHSDSFSLQFSPSLWESSLVESIFRMAWTAAAAAAGVFPGKKYTVCEKREWAGPMKKLLFT